MAWQTNIVHTQTFRAILLSTLQVCVRSDASNGPTKIITLRVKMAISPVYTEHRHTHTETHITTKRCRHPISVCSDRREAKQMYVCPTATHTSTAVVHPSI